MLRHPFILQIFQLIVWHLQKKKGSGEHVFQNNVDQPIVLDMWCIHVMNPRVGRMIWVQSIWSQGHHHVWHNTVPLYTAPINSTRGRWRTCASSFLRMRIRGANRDPDRSLRSRTFFTGVKSCQKSTAFNRRKSSATFRKQMLSTEEQHSCRKQLLSVEEQHCCRKQLLSVEEQRCCQKQLLSVEEQHCCQKQLLSLEEQHCCENSCYQERAALLSKAAAISSRAALLSKAAANKATWTTRLIESFLVETF